MMDCLHSMAPNDEELLRYVLDDEPLPPEVQTHLGRCVICQQRLADYKELNTLLISRLYRSECPSAMDLNLFCEHLLPLDDMRRIDRHICQCPPCAVEVADIQQMLATCISLSTPDPPHLPLLPHAAPLTSKRVVASLMLIQPQMVTRGKDSSSTWPRQYRADSINISLHLSHGSNREIVLLGLFTRNDPDTSVDAFEEVLAELYSALDLTKEQGEQLSDEEYDKEYREQPVMSARVDDLGNLVFKDVPVGTYLMIVYLPDAELVIEGLTIER